MTSLFAHIDLLCFERSAGDDFVIFVTCGMSDAAMLKDDLDKLREAGWPPGVMGPTDGRDAFCELVLLAPRILFESGSPASPENWVGGNLMCLGLTPDAAEAFDWFVLWNIAKYPIMADTLIWRGHSFGDGSSIYPGYRMAGIFMDESRWLHDSARCLDLNDAERIEFFTLIPLYPEEVSACFDNRAAFLAHLAEADVSQIFSDDRPSSVKRAAKARGFWSRWFGGA